MLHLAVDVGGTFTDVRSITWGIEGGLPSCPHGVWLDEGDSREKFLGAVFSGVSVESGAVFTRPPGVADMATRSGANPRP